MTLVALSQGWKKLWRSMTIPSVAANTALNAGISMCSTFDCSHKILSSWVFTEALLHCCDYLNCCLLKINLTLDIGLFP